VPSVVPGDSIRFELAALPDTEPASPPSEVPSDVVDAVRRAIAAIESASQPVPVIKVDRSAAPVPRTLDEALASLEKSAPVAAPVDRGAPGGQSPTARPDPFAMPPSLASAASPATPAVTGDLPVVAPGPVAAPIVPTLPSAGHDGPVGGDADGSGGDDDRKGALRRLIGGLRRKS
jgi:hypothetical protein